ncbi:bifunctional ADP-dependent NAD(P)H-hydrate dehydratase/NAD(P)H-hydrate epimerase [Sphingomonas sp. Mn802worker]|uniref:bifunctional ADP-dependent NAD(P)H-hydrate dehydratase/NAD(P)H-hydrate epimerase n=1 Tax=Sphingomonas sp. Mn802worker TaxID=629773 RepID=UPI00036146FE|nr:bifunctional ADP-dependent NAD(P)H-hydrate dehydratase/NAD(P)H-hydrate epimerase [Sphingomonas sp. Mn802worker]
MKPIAGAAVLTAAEMRAAEARAFAAGEDAWSMMQRAGRACAAAIRRLSAGAEVLVLCGPGNNGGDGYVIAATLADAGYKVRVAALGTPRGEVAQRARANWSGSVASLDQAQSAPVLVDALFGLGLNRALDATVAGDVHRLAAAAALTIAIDLPSGIDSDSGALLGCTIVYDVTLALGALKPAHLLQPAASHCGTVRWLDIGVQASDAVRVLLPPTLPRPGPQSHKFNRGMVGVVRGRMAGASELAAAAAMHAGAGYVALLGASIPAAPHALVRRRLSDEAMADPRMGALVVGPGLGRDDDMRALVSRALKTDHPLVVDGDALHLVTPEQLHARGGTMILTPHAGEFDALFGPGEGSKIDRTHAAAHRSGAVVVFKGADTVIAAPDNRVRLAPAASNWLSIAGSGDVLAGAIAACLATTVDALDAAAAGVWRHGDAARRCGASFIADDLAHALSEARAACA